MFWSNKKEEQRSEQKNQSSNSTAKQPSQGSGSSIDYQRVQSALGAGTIIQGKLSFDTPVRIDGKLSGEVFSTSTLIIGETGVVDAQVEAESLVILGKVKGQVTVREKVELRSGGELEGEVTSKSLRVETGAVLNGSCRMIQTDAQKKQTPKLARPSKATAVPFAQGSTPNSEPAPAKEGPAEGEQKQPEAAVH